MNELPAITIVVPNYNGGATIEATLISLIEQRYPKLEILVVDGGSTDNSVEVIRRYEDKITWWVSEKDRGQSHAINKGFARANGEILNWLCSDDILLPGALETVGKIFFSEPETDVVAGTTIEHFENGRREDRAWVPSEELIRILPVTAPFGQPSCFYRRRLIEGRQPPVDESYHYALDTELWTYFKSIGACWKLIDTPLSRALHWEQNKTSTGGVKIIWELERLYKSYMHERIPLTFWHRHLRFPLERIRHKHRGFLFSCLYYPYQCSIIVLLSPFYGFTRCKWMNWVEYY
jgi:glycosyltransferase involved in cell wall biosynthesis